MPLFFKELVSKSEMLFRAIFPPLKSCLVMNAVSYSQNMEGANLSCCLVLCRPLTD